MNTSDFDKPLSKPPIGEGHRIAYWYSAQDPLDKTLTKDRIEEDFLIMGLYMEVRFSPIEWSEALPGDMRIEGRPPEGMVEPRCMVGFAKVIEHPDMREKDITEDLSPESLRDLRIKTREIGNRLMGVKLTDEECDRFINMWGPEVVWEETVH